jgi:asparagine synthase (glutamine-hydrolysing)
VLSGEGADEALAGYDMERVARQMHRLRPLDAVPRPALRLAARVVPRGRGLLAGLAEGGVQGYLPAIGSHMTHVFGETEKAALWRDGDGFASTDDLIRGWYAETTSPEPIDQLQQVLCRSWLVEDLLMKADKMTMAASLELRTPFLDHALVEWAACAPLSLKVGDARTGWSSKRVLREFAARRLPAEIVNRPKQGFPVPAYDALQGELGGWAQGRLEAPDGALGELFDTARFAGLATAARAGDTEAAHKVWVLLVLDAWLERWL